MNFEPLKNKRKTAFGEKIKMGQERMRQTIVFPFKTLKLFLVSSPETKVIE